MLQKKKSSDTVVRRPGSYLTQTGSSDQSGGCQSSSGCAVDGFRIGDQEGRMLLQAAGHPDVVHPQEPAARERDIPGGAQREHRLPPAARALGELRHSQRTRQRSPSSPGPSGRRAAAELRGHRRSAGALSSSAPLADLNCPFAAAVSLGEVPTASSSLGSFRA
uniref:Uncharacterized protein n=1 Tax=Sphaerodactylus townsendi TaxID=933632 RepID=A0ACB8G341_9SAUR